MTNYEMVERLREKADVSYEEAKRALEETNWDILEAMLLLEKQGVTMKGGSGYSTKAAPEAKEEPEEKETSAFGDGMRQIGCWLRKIVRMGSDNSFVISRKGNEIISFPVIVLVILVLATAVWPSVMVLVAGLFFGLRYSFRGPNLGKDSINDAMGKATDAAENVVNEFQSRKEKTAPTENTKDSEEPGEE